MKFILKRLKKNYFFFFVIICIILDFFVVIHNTIIEYPQMYANKSIYEEEFAFLEGNINKGKLDSLIEYGDNLNKQINELSEVTSQYRLGKITTEQFKNKIKVRNKLLNIQDLYNEIYSHYINLLDSSNNYFTDINGLRNLFEMDISIPLIIFMTYLISILFVQDNEIGVTNIFESTPLKSVYFKNRVFIICGLSMIFLLIHELFKIIFIYFTFGFGNGSALICSSSLFENTIFLTTFSETYLLYLLIKFVGCIFSSVLLSAIGKRINYVLHFVMVVLCMYLFPFLVINNQKVLNYLLWIGLNQPIYYFLGVKLNSETQEIIFHNFSYNEIILIILISLFIIFVILKYSKKKFIVIVMVFSCLLTGCSNSENNKTSIVNINNSITEKVFCANDIYTFDIDNEIMFENGDKNKQYKIERDIFINDYQLSCGDVYEDNYYYVISTKSFYQIKRLNINDFTSEILYEHYISNDNIVFKDVLNLFRYTTKNDIEIPHLILGNSSYLSVVYNRKIGIFDLKKKRFINYIEDVVYQNNMALCEQNFYYINGTYQLKKIDLLANKSINICEIPIESFFIDDKYIYYKPMNENKICFRFLTNDKTIHSLDIEATYFFVQNEYLYYVDINDSNAYKYSFKTKDSIKILSREVYTFQVHQDFMIFSFPNDENNEIEIGLYKII